MRKWLTLISGQLSQVLVDARIEASLRVSWLKDGREMSGDGGGGGGRVVVGPDGLTIANVSKTDEGVYTCLADTDYDSASETGRLPVMSEPPSFTSTPRDIRVLEGRDAELVCRATGNPAPAVVWRRAEDDDEMPSDGAGRLVLSSVSPGMEGSYLCRAENVYGAIEEAVSVLVIQAVRKKEVENLVPDVVKKIRETISLPCDFSVDRRVEKETQVVWLKDGDRLDLDDDGNDGGPAGRKYAMTANKSLVIADLELADEGRYTCRVITPLQTVESRLSLIVSGESPKILNKVKI